MTYIRAVATLLRLMLLSAQLKLGVAIMALSRELRYGAFESNPAIFNDFEAWVQFGTKDWQKMPVAEVRYSVGVLSKAAFDKTYGHLPALPKTAFQSSDIAS
jgi:hypothetical protein